MSGSPPSRGLVELLAPAGDRQAMRAAVANGADAVYFGLQEFNARRRAANFDVANLGETVEFLHRRNVKAFITFNTLVFTDELAAAERYLVQIAEAGADAVIVQDVGLIRLIQRLAPSLPVHASTQMTQTHPAGIAALQAMGVRRVILARELSLEQIRRITSAVDIEIEVFVHGAMCISFSGQCLASESFWGRSANRGECGQACRLPYGLLVDGHERPVAEGDHLLSPKDLALHDRIPDLLDAGVRAFKIEGRLKSAEYVAAATRVYRAAIDAAIEGRAFHISREQRQDLAQSFSRGFSEGFLDGRRHQQLVDARSPKSRGVPVGTVAGRTRQGILVTLADVGIGEGDAVGLKPGDGVVFEAGQPDTAQGGRVYGVKVLGGGASRRGRVCEGDDRERRDGVQVELTFGRGDVDIAAVPVGCRVWKTADPESQRRLQSTYSRDVVPLRMVVNVRADVSLDRRLTVRLHDESGREATVASEAPLEPARNRPLTVQVLAAQFGRLGDTPYRLGGVVLRGPEGEADSIGVLAPASMLNAMRREAVESLMEQRRRGSQHAVADPNALQMLRGESAPAVTAEARPGLGVLVRRMEQLEAVLQGPEGSSRPSLVYCEPAEPRLLKEAVERMHGAGVLAGLVTPRVLLPGEERLLMRIRDAGPDVVLVRDLASLDALRNSVPSAELVADHGLNVANDLSAWWASAMGFARVTPAYDLSSGQLRELLDHSPGTAFELVVHQHMPLFHTAYCVAAARLSKGDDCRSCGRPCSRHRVALRDRTGMVLPIVADVGGRSAVFSGSVQSAADLLGPLSAGHVRMLRVEFLDESPQLVGRVLALYTLFLKSEIDGAEVMRELRRLYSCTVSHGTYDWR